MLLPGLTIPDITSEDWDNELTVTLARADSSPADESEGLVADGTLIPIVPPHSRLVSLRLNFKVLGAASTQNVYRWALVKNPDGDSILTNMSTTAQTFHAASLTPTTREVNKYTLAKGIAVTNPSTAISNLNVFVKRSAMRRVSGFKADDTLTFHIAKDTAGTTSILHGMGTLYFRANA